MKINLNMVIIRFAREGDAEDVINLLCELTDSIRSRAGWENYEVKAKMDEQKEKFRSIVLNRFPFFIAEYEGKIVGALNAQPIVNIRHGWNRLHIEELIVEKEYRKMGIGTKLINKLKEYARNNGYGSIKLLCGSQLNDTHAFYEKNGFIFLDRGYRFPIL